MPISSSGSNRTPIEAALCEYSPSVQDALRELIKAYQLAIDAGREKWDFAVEHKVLRRLGLTESDFRWLVCKGIVDHAREMTDKECTGRRFRSTNTLRFKKRTCFVLTEGFAKKFTDNDAVALGLQALQVPAEAPHVIPRWDRCRHELCVSDFLVKGFRWPAKNQETILAAFEEDKWPTGGIDDPLSPHPEQDPKQRLRDTIKCLNRYQTNRFIRFRGDGTGKRVIWGFTSQATVVLGLDRSAMMPASSRNTSS